MGKQPKGKVVRKRWIKRKGTERTYRTSLKSAIQLSKKCTNEDSQDEDLEIDVVSDQSDSETVLRVDVNTDIDQGEHNLMAQGDTNDPADANKVNPINTDKDATVEAEYENISFQESFHEDSHEDYNLSYVDKCIYDCKNGDFLDKLFNILHRYNCLQDFMTLLQLLVSGELSPLNIAFLLCLERAKWHECRNTVGMRYRNITRQFWEIVYRVCKGVTITLFGGRKNRCDVVCQRTERGYYDPRQSDVNFAVPDKKILQKGKFLTEHDRPPGIFSDVLQKVDTSKEYILSWDGKRIARGLGKANMSGDINLWGYEQPNLQEKLMRLQSELLQVDNLNPDLIEQDIQELAERMRCLVKINTTRIHEMRQQMLKEQTKLDRLLNPSPQNANKNFEMQISDVKQILYRRQMWTSEALDLNKSILEVMSKFQRTNHLFCYGPNITLTCQNNIRRLHQPELVSQHMDLEDLPHLCKQGSEQWFNFRKRANVTSSSIHNALGLRNVKSLVEHFRHYVYKQDQAQFPPEDQVRLDWGKEHEADAIATLAGLVLPSYACPCSVLYEDGVNFHHGIIKQFLLADSPDGIIRVLQGIHQCYNVLGYDHKKIVVEAKCPYGNKWTVPQFYEVHFDHILQCLCHMKCKGADICWYTCWTEESTIVIEIFFDEETWNAVWELVLEWYDSLNPKQPKNVKEVRQKLELILKEFRSQNTNLLCEVPSLRGKEGPVEEANPFCPYHIPSEAVQFQTSLEEMKEDVEKIVECNTLCLQEAHELMRQQAHEILAFVLTDTDRKKSQDHPAIIPVGYCMKGTSISHEVMHKLVHDVREKCKQYNINIIANTCDGQFWKMAFLDEEGSPLTILRLQHEHWKKSLSLQKTDMIGLVDTISGVSDQTLSSLSNWTLPTDKGSFASGNVEIMWSKRRDGSTKLEIRSVGTENFFMGDISTPSRKSHPTLWKKIDKKSAKPPRLGNIPQDLNISEVQKLIPSSLSQAQQDHTQIHNETLRSLLRSDSESSDEEYDPFQDSGEQEDSEDDEEFYDDLNVSVLKRDTETLFLENVMTALRNCRNGQKWKTMSLKDMHEQVFVSAQETQKLYVYELDAIGKVIYQFTGKLPFPSKATKGEKVNAICRVFGDSSTVEVSRRTRQAQPYSNDMLTLKKISKGYILSSSYPKELIAAAYCKISFPDQIRSWSTNPPLPCELTVKNSNLNHDTYSIPNVCQHRQQIEITTIDPNHILNNLRLHCTTKKVNLCDPLAFRRVYQYDNKVLPMAVIEDQLDKQNVGISKKVFSEEVENIMLLNGDDREAELVRTVRNWFAACDEREIDTLQRLKYLQDMFNYLLKDVTVYEFPPQLTHMKGLPIITWESILQGIDVKFQLFLISSQQKYNPRAISTLAIETFFGHLSRYEFTSTGNPKATQIYTIMGNLLTLLKHQSDTERGFHMITTLRPFYPDYSLESEAETSSHEESETESEEEGRTAFRVKTHQFDRKRHMKRKKKRVKWAKIAKPDEQTRGGRGVRQYHHIDESKMSGEKRLGKQLQAVQTRHGYKIQ